MPPKAKKQPKGKRYPLNMRTTRELREQLEAAAEASGRSLVQEVEYRLDQSLRDDSLTSAFLGGGATADALRLISMAMKLHSTGGKSWADNRINAVTVRVAVDQIIASVARLPRVPPVMATPERNPQQWQQEGEALKRGENVPAVAGRDTAAVLLLNTGYKLAE